MAYGAFGPKSERHRNTVRCRTPAFWMEHRLWGDAVVGYHLINILLHSLCAGLVILILRRLRLPGAWLAGLIFALHPVCVEAVAWISQQESTLSAFFYLASALIYLRFDEDRLRSWYLCATGLFMLALLSNPVTATLPAALLLILWWRLKRISLETGSAAALAVVGAERFPHRYYLGPESIRKETQRFRSPFQRFLLAGHAAWFYLAKLVRPSNLTLIYPRFTIDSGVWWQYLYPAGILALTAFLLIPAWPGISKQSRLSTFRQAPGFMVARPASGWLFFMVTLFPILGFLNLSPFLILT